MESTLRNFVASAALSLSLLSGSVIAQDTTSVDNTSEVQPQLNLDEYYFPADIVSYTPPEGITLRNPDNFLISGAIKNNLDTLLTDLDQISKNYGWKIVIESGYRS